MPLENTQQTTYLAISGGRFKKKVSPGTPGAIPRTNKNGVEVYELSFNALRDVLILGLSVDETDFGTMLKIVCCEKDGTDEYTISTPIKSGYARKFLNVVPNIDFTKPLTLGAYSRANKSDPSKTTTSLFVKQNGVNIKGFYTYWDKEVEATIYQNGIPEFGNGKFTQRAWDKYIGDVVDFYIDMLNNGDWEFVTKPNKSENDISESNSEYTDDDSDDIPF